MVAAENGRTFPFLYADAALAGNTGHHANACRHIVGELRGRGIHVVTLGHVDMAPGLAEEVRAAPWFRHSPYAILAAYPQVSHWIGRMSFAHDLARAWRLRPASVVYLNSVLPAQFEAVGRWLQGLGSALPFVAVEFGTPSGETAGGYFSSFPAQYRAASRFYRDLPRDRVLLFAFEATASEEYSRLLGLPVATMPPVHGSIGPLRRRLRGEDGAITLGFLGHQREEKGVQLIPDIVRRLRKRGSRARVLLHDGDPSQRPVIQELLALAAEDPGVVFEHRPADQTYWQSLLDRTDLLVLPYEPRRYQASYSAMAVEAVSAGLPMVVPGATTMATLVEAYQGQVTAFEGWDAEGICTAILQAEARFDVLAAQAEVGAGRWAAQNGVKAFVDQLLEAGRPLAEPPPAVRSGSPVTLLKGLLIGLILKAAHLRRWLLA